MRTYLPLIACMALGACASIKYRGWEQVRVEKAVPDSECTYQVQEACPPLAMEGCLNYFKKRATRFDANTVVLTESRLAEYYQCPRNR